MLVLLVAGGAGAAGGGAVAAGGGGGGGVGGAATGWGRWRLWCRRWRVVHIVGSEKHKRQGFIHTIPVAGLSFDKVAGRRFIDR